MSSVDAVACYNCEFCEKAEDKERFVSRLECRRYPPVAGVPRDNRASSWPDVAKDDWCGEFKSRWL